MIKFKVFASLLLVFLAKYKSHFIANFLQFDLNIKLKAPFFAFVLFLFVSNVEAQVTNSWTGKTSTDWNTAANWSNNTVPGTLDNIQLGIVATNNQPVINSSFTIGNLTMGVYPLTLTITAGNILTVSGAVTQNHSTNNMVPLTTLAGAGGLICNSFVVGGNIPPHFIQSATTEVISQLGQLTINGNLIINSVTMDLLSGGVGNNNALFSLEGGAVNLSGQIKIVNTMAPYLVTQITTPPSSVFSIDITSSQNATLFLTDSNAVNLTNSAWGYVNFNNSSSGTGSSTVEYVGANQNIYQTTHLGIGQYGYYNLVIGGSGVKTFGNINYNNLATGGSVTVLPGATLNLPAYLTSLLVHGNYINRGTTLLSAQSGAIFYGSNFINSGAFNMPVTSSSVPIKFFGGTQNIIDSTTTGLPFQFLMFSNPGVKHINYGNVSVIPNGIVNIIGGATVNVDNGATLTLRADTTGSAAIGPIPQGSSITGQVDVQQFIAGSVGTAARGYLFMSSPVNLSNSINGDRQYGINYLHGTSLTSGIFIGGPGGSANGFDNGSNVNPLMYLFREDIPTCNTNFFCSQSRGVLKINYPDPNQIGTSTRYNNTSTPDTVIYLPIANGFEVYYLGNRVLSNGTTSGTKFSAPVNYPENVTLNNTGTINQSNIQVKVWFRSDHYLSYTNLSNSNDPGVNLLGNPYPSAINWDYISTTNSGAQLYGPNLKTTIYIMNPLTHQEQPYQADSTHSPNTVYYGVGLASNIIQSSQGFSVTVDPSSPDPAAASLLFREGCKQNNQIPDTTGTFGIGGPPVNLNPLAIRYVAANSLVKSAVSSAKTSSGNTATVSTSKVNFDKVPVKAAARQFPPVLVRLKLDNMDLDTASNNDEILIDFKNNAKQKYLAKEDAYDLGGDDSVKVMLSSYSSDHIALAINTLPLPAVKENIVLYTDGTLSGNYKLLFTQLDNIPLNYTLELRDKLTGAVNNIKDMKGYSFKIDKNIPASFGDRFEIFVTNKRRIKY